MSITDRFEAQTLALAGIAQSVHLALTVARDGQADPQASGASLGSVLRLTAESPEAVFGGLAGVRTGLRVLVGQLRGENRDAELVRITATVMSLERRYSRDAGVQAELRRRLELIAREHDGQAADVPAMKAIADAYLATLSTLTPRIRVPGNPMMLKQDDNVMRIRAFLMAAIRSAALWHQLGGRGWRTLLQRGRIIETAQQLLGRSLASV